MPLGVLITEAFEGFERLRRADFVDFELLGRKVFKPLLLGMFAVEVEAVAALEVRLAGAILRRFGATPGMVKMNCRSNPTKAKATKN